MIHIIAAVAENNAIGKDNQLLWHIPRDLKRFKKLTLNHPIIMGRKTFESFGSIPLPKRQHIIISSSDKENTKQITWVKSLREAIEKGKELDDTIYIIGGGSIYEQAMEFAQQLDITRVHAKFDGDTFFPPIPERFICIEDQKNWENDLPFTYSFRTYLIK
ncbi:dihydrofolate reductase [Flavobacteriaceae bacterium Ap0902]|nr:dihydrofolate reductase [Flavobacteriaceae bacterium Ap0902]